MINEETGFLHLEAGLYVLRVKVAWEKEETGKYGLSINSERPLTLKHADRHKHKDFVLHYVKSKLKINKQDDIGSDCTSSCGWMDAPPVFGFYVQNNGEGTMTYARKLTSSSKNFKVPKQLKTDFEDICSIVVASKSDGVGYFKKIDRKAESSLSYGTSKKYKYHLQHKTQKEVESHRRHAEYFKFDVAEPGKITVSVLQKDARYFKPNDEYKYSYVQMVLLKRESENQYKLIGNFFIV